MSAQDFFEDKIHILVVDDDDRIRQLIQRFLTKEDFIVASACDAQETKDILQHAKFDALVIDIMMPGQDGVSLTEELKSQQEDIPILLLTALGEADDRIKGLESGADDYLTKPFEPKELSLRLKALTRRARAVSINKHEKHKQYNIGEWVYTPQYADLKSANSQMSATLTSGENNLLHALAKNYGQILNRDQLASLCQINSGDRTIDVQVTRLRRKIETDPKLPKNLQTIRGQGYVLNATPINE